VRGRWVVEELERHRGEEVLGQPRTHVTEEVLGQLSTRSEMRGEDAGQSWGKEQDKRGG
jgi:hypothetical protein